LPGADGAYGIGALTAVTILAELGDCRRFGSSRDAVRYSGWTSPCADRDKAGRPRARTDP
jgi:transposase